MSTNTKHDDFEEKLSNGLKAAFEGDKISVSDELFARTLSAIRQLETERETQPETENHDKENTISIDNGRRNRRAGATIFVRYAGGIAAALLIAFIGIRLVSPSYLLKNDSFDSGALMHTPTPTPVTQTSGLPDSNGMEIDAVAEGAAANQETANFSYSETDDVEERATESDDYYLSEYSETADGGYSFVRSVNVGEDRELGLVVYGSALENTSDMYGISKIEVTEDDALIQTISVSEAVDSEWGVEFASDTTEALTMDGGLVIDDINFDGAEDIGLMGWITTGANIPHYYWTWNDADNCFNYAFCMCNVVVDDENRQLVSGIRVNAAEYDTKYYIYDDNGGLVLVKQVIENYADEDGHVIETWVLMDGEMVLESREIQ